MFDDKLTTEPFDLVNEDTGEGLRFVGYLFCRSTRQHLSYFTTEIML